MEQLGCMAVGYALGSLLTAELVARLAAGQRPAQMGSGNPGMANMVRCLGLRWGLLVLAGDLAKTFAACLACRFWLFPAAGPAGVLWAGLGAVLGHNYPLWFGFRGGKGVAVTCACLFCFSPLWGLGACLAGLAAVLLTQYLAVGALVIPLAFLPVAWLGFGPECGLLACALALLMLLAHLPGLRRAAHGQEPRVDLLHRRPGPGAPGPQG